MGPLIPVLAAAGGGSALAGGVALASAAVGIYGAVEQHRAGQEAKAESKQAAMREASAARQEEIERRRGLMKVLAARSASAGAAGVTTGGSIGALTRQDIKDNRNDLLVSDVNSATRQRALRQAGNSAARTGTANAATSLLDTARTGYRAMG
jgi:hypothetical protein